VKISEITGKLGNKDIVYLLDEGSSKSFLDLAWFEKYFNLQDLDTSVKVSMVLAIRNNKIETNETLGRIDLDVILKNKKYPWTFHVVEGLAQNAFLGLDFTTFYSGIINRKNNSLTLENDKETEIISLKSHDDQIRVSEDTIIKAQSEAIIPIDISTNIVGTLISNSNKNSCRLSTGLIYPNTHYIHISNFSSKDIKLTKGEIVGYIEPILEKPIISEPHDIKFGSILNKKTERKNSKYTSKIP